jgi:hypothetical protein
MKLRLDRKSPWRKLTRRDFVAMIGAAAAAALAVPARSGLVGELASDELAEARARRRSRSGRKTVWIGHC